jgi:hypothetical protein
MNPGDITIDPEFKNFIRPLSTEERKELKESLSSAGLLMPLVVWRHEGKNILVDGHNRLSLWKEFDGFDGDFEFKTQELRFGNRDKVKKWIIQNQLGRRNLSADDFKLLVGQLYNQRKKNVGKPAGTVLDQIDPISTAAAVAAETGVSPATVKRAGRLAAKVEEIKQAEPELPREEVIAKAKGESKSAVAQLEKTIEDEEQEYNKFLDSPFGKAAQAIGKIAQSVPMPTPETLRHASFFADHLQFELLSYEWHLELNRLAKERTKQVRAERKATNRGGA